MVQTRRLRFGRTNGIRAINGKVWRTGRIDATPQVGTTEEWIVEITSGG